MDFAAENKIRQRVLSMCAPAARCGLRCSRHSRRGASRRRRSFNRTESEFASVNEYNDYLEQVEDMSARPRAALRRTRLRGQGVPLSALAAPPSRAVFNLVNRTEVVATEAKISAYQAANAESITANRVRRVRVFALCAFLARR